MNRNGVMVVVLLLLAYCFWPATPPVPAPVAPVPVKPVEPAKPKVPKPCPGPFCPKEDAAVGATVGGNVAPDGTPICCDLPGSEHLRNKGGRDGAGLCVFTSIDHSARWQNVPQLVGFRDWMTKHPGGGYPSKVKDMIGRICKERGMPEPVYIQVEGSDLDILRLACQTGRMPGVTYGFSPSGRYGGQRIAHMVSLPHADEKHFAVLDNNYPGPDKYEWLTPDEFKRAYTSGGGGWSVILLAPPPPPPPTN